MKAITLWEPYASLVAMGIKTIETRSWLTNYRGQLLIHAAKHRPTAAEKRLLTQLKTEFGIEVMMNPGCIVAVCNLVDCIMMTSELIAKQSAMEIIVGDWQPQRYAFLLENISPVAPINACGFQGLWNPSVKVLAEVF